MVLLQGEEAAVLFQNLLRVRAQKLKVGMIVLTNTWKRNADQNKFLIRQEQEISYLI